MSVTPNDEQVVCRSCGMVTHARGGDTEGWKAVQLGSAEDGMSWYCSKDVCQENFHAVVDAKIREMRTAQGLPPDPPPNPPDAGRPKHPMADQDNRVLGMPPGWSQAVERRQGPEEEGDDIKPQDTIQGSGQRNRAEGGKPHKPQRRRNVPEGD